MMFWCAEAGGALGPVVALLLCAPAVPACLLSARRLQSAAEPQLAVGVNQHFSLKVIILQKR